MWIGGGLVVLAIVFLAAKGDGTSGSVTVPPVASGLAQAPETLVVQADPDSASTTPVTDSTAIPADDTAGTIDTAAPVLAATPNVVRERAPDTAPAVHAAIPTENEDTSARVLVIAPQTTPALPALREVDQFDYRWARTWVNVRANRSGSSDAVRILNPGEQVGVDSLGRGWFRVLIDGVPVGYVDRSFLAMAPPDSLPG